MVPHTSAFGVAVLNAKQRHHDHGLVIGSSKRVNKRPQGIRFFSSEEQNCSVFDNS